MPESLFSASWYRVAELRPRLRRHARIHRHVYRGEPWYVLEDVVNQRVHRFTPATHTVIALMDGTHSIHELWETATETLADDAPTQDEMIRLLAQLHAADVLQCDVPPDTAELLERYQKHERKQWQSRLLSPFAIRIPLIDPDRFLRQLVPLARPLMSWFGVALWLAVVMPALVLVGVHWSPLTEGILDRILTPQNLILIWLIFPVVKALHEFGHGILVRFFGGEVHDMGIMFLVFTPIPYVDASSASAFPVRYQRALVASGGIIVEVFLAALAFYFWLSAEPGAARTVAYNAMLIAGVTTLTFNANPLLRFDGYYILSDLIEIPNLRQRSNQYFGHLVERYAFGNLEAEHPPTSATERWWLVTYAVAAFAYRMFIIAVIMLFVFDISIVLGVVLASVSAVGWIGMPLTKMLRFLFTSPKLRTVRSRAIGVAAGALALLLLVVFVLPLPFRTRAEGVVWIPDEALVRAEADGFIERLLAIPGSQVQAGDPLFECRDPDIEAMTAVLAARLRGIEAREQKARAEDLAQAEILAEELYHVQRRLARAEERLAALVIRSGRDGIFTVPHPEDLPGRFVVQGELLAHVVELDAFRVRAVVPQQDIELLRKRLQGIAVRRAEGIDEVLEGRLVRLGPTASGELPSAALGSRGGGNVAIDPRDERGMSAVAPVFQVELEVPLPPDVATVGGRVHVRFDHGLESLAARWYRSLRQIFLSRLNV